MRYPSRQRWRFATSRVLQNMTETRIINIKSGEPYDVCIMRPSFWSNKYSHLPHARAIKVKTRKEAIQRFEQDARNIPEFMARLPELEGKVLACCCKPKPCHGDVIIKLLRELKWF